MKRQGCSILFVNEQRQILLFLRDDLPTSPIPTPGMCREATWKRPKQPLNVLFAR